MIDAEVVEAHACPDQVTSAVKSAGDWAPEYAPPPCQDAKSTLDGHSVGALVEIEVVILPICGNHHVLCRDKGRVAPNEELGGELAPLEPDTEGTRPEGDIVVGCSSLGDVKVQKATTLVAQCNAQCSIHALATHIIPGWQGRVCLVVGVEHRVH